MWPHYRKLPPVSGPLIKPAGFSSSELLREVCKDKIRSIYQQDYAPLLQGELITLYFSLAHFTRVWKGEWVITKLEKNKRGQPVKVKNVSREMS